MHGRFYQSEELNQGGLAAIEPFALRFRRLDQYHGLKDACDRGLIAAEAVTPPSVMKRRSEVWPLTLRAVDLQMEGPRTINHGDVHLGNWYVRGDSEMGLTDFQNVTTGHWSRDLAYTISTALAVDDRRAWEQDLVRLYLARLAEHGGRAEPFEESWARYRQQMLSVLAYWTVTLTPSPTMAQDMQTKETTLCFLGRITQAIEDLKTLDAFD
jgi:aminoglycoside phosphotransferase (APT) family kinase protein